MSVTGLNNFKLPETAEENLRVILNAILSSQNATFLEKIQTEKTLLKSHPIQINILERNKESDVPYVVFSSTNNFAPYCLIINEFVVFYYNKIKSINAPKPVFFNLEKYISKDKLYYKSQPLIISKIGENDYINAAKKILDIHTVGIIQLIAIKITEIYKRLISNEPNEAIIRKCLEHVTSGDFRADKFEIDEISSKMTEFFMATFVSKDDNKSI